jgi:hypothetical protein
MGGSYFHRSFLWILFFVVSVAVSAQNKLETDQGLAEAIAPYDVNVRQSILVASEYSSVLTQLQKSQDQTMASFQKMIGRYRQKKQEWFYTITRYPDVMHHLANLPGKQTEEAVYKLLPSQDPDLKEAAWHLYKTQKKNLAKLDNIRMMANMDFEKLIVHLNTPAREAFHKLQNRPDVLTLLTNNIDLTTKLGERYKNNSTEVTDQLAALHDKLELENQREAAAFKKQMESDPKAIRELRQASNAYGGNSYYNPYYYPYSYWFGYPYWYYYPMWYPGMFGYYPGFYFGAGGLYGFPSYGFSFWFYNGGYYTCYPHLYRRFGDYYQRNVATSTVTTPVTRGFASAATTHYQPMNTRLSSTLASPYEYRQSNTLRQTRMGYNGNMNLNNYHAQSMGGFGGRGSLIGGSVGGGVSIGRGRR